jgi:hypothetical protein
MTPVPLDQIGQARDGPYAGCYVRAYEQRDGAWLVLALDADAEPRGSVGWEAWAHSPDEALAIMKPWNVEPLSDEDAASVDAALFRSAWHGPDPVVPPVSE